MDVKTRIILFLIIAIVSVIPSLVAFFEMKKRDGTIKRILMILGIVFIPTHIIFAGLSLLAQTNDGFTIMSLTWFSIIIFILCELAIYLSTIFYFLKIKEGQRKIYTTFSVLTGVFGVVYPLYHYLICYSIDLLTMIVFLLPTVAYTAVLALIAKSYPKIKKPQKPKK